MTHHLKTIFYSFLFASLSFTSCNGQNNSSQLLPWQLYSISKQADSFSNKTKPNPTNNHIRNSVIEDKEGNLWFGTSGNGLFRYDGKTSTHFTMNDGLCGTNVLALYEDSKGRIWVSTGKKVCFYNGTTFTSVPIIGADSSHFSYQPSQNKSVGIWGICEDKKGNIWFTAFDAGVYCYDGKTVTHFQIGGLMQGITADNEGNLWFNFIRYDGNTFTTVSPYGSTGSAWVMCSLKDKKNNLWFSVKKDGLYYYNGKTFNHYTMKDGLCDDYDECEFIYEDKTGKIWVGTNGNGPGNDDLCLCYFDGKSFHQATDILSTKELIHSDARPVVGDKEGNIWISAGNLLFRYNGKTLTDFTSKVFLQ